MVHKHRKSDHAYQCQRTEKAREQAASTLVNQTCFKCDGFQWTGLSSGLHLYLHAGSPVTVVQALNTSYVICKQMYVYNIDTSFTAHTNTNTKTNSYVCMYACMYVCMCVYTHIDMMCVKYEDTDGLRTCCVAGLPKTLQVN